MKKFFIVLGSMFLAIIVLGGIGIAFELVSGISCIGLFNFRSGFEADIL